MVPGGFRRDTVEIVAAGHHRGPIALTQAGVEDQPTLQVNVWVMVLSMHWANWVQLVLGTWRSPVGVLRQKLQGVVGVRSVRRRRNYENVLAKKNAQRLEVLNDFSS